MHILANIRPKICWLIFGSKCVTFWVAIREGGGSRRMVYKCDMGEGVENFDIWSDILLEWSPN